MPPRKKKGADRGTVGLSADEVASGKPPAAVQELAAQVAADGALLATYREPLGGHWVLLASLPIDKVSPTPYQRELSEAHVERLAGVIPKVGRFLDPVIAIRHDGGYWTPNGMHRLSAMQRLGARAITALVVPEREIAYRILALNTEKAHNLKDKSLEVIRMARGLAAEPETAKRPESDWAFEFEEPGYLTIGCCYEKNARFSGSVYLPVVKRCLTWGTGAIAESIPEHEERAEGLLALDAVVAEVVKKLKAAGFQSGYLKPFVVARINPLRFVKTKPGQKAAAADWDATLAKMRKLAEGFDIGKVKATDVAAAAGAGGAPEES